MCLRRGRLGGAGPLIQGACLPVPFSLLLVLGLRVDLNLGALGLWGSVLAFFPPPPLSPSCPSVVPTTQVGTTSWLLKMPISAVCRPPLVGPRGLLLLFGRGPWPALGTPSAPHFPPRPLGSWVAVLLLYPCLCPMSPYCPSSSEQHCAGSVLRDGMGSLPRVNRVTSASARGWGERMPLCRAGRWGRSVQGTVSVWEMLGFPSLLPALHLPDPGCCCNAGHPGSPQCHLQI